MQRDQSCPHSPETPPFSTLPPASPSLPGPSLYSDHSLFLQRPPFWKRDCTHFVSNMLYFFVNSSTAPKEIRRGAGRKGERIHPPNEKLNPPCLGKGVLAETRAWGSSSDLFSQGTGWMNCRSSLPILKPSLVPLLFH